MDYSNKTIDALIEMKFGEIVERAVKQYITDVPTELEKALEYEHEDNIDELQLDELTYKYCTNITVDEDNLIFDYIVDAEFTILTYANDYDEGTEDYGNKWLAVHCRALGAGDQRYLVDSVSIYIPGTTTNRFIPIMARTDYDAEATAFLQDNCPEVLSSPMATPIKEIIHDKMMLDLVADKRLSDDFTLFGQICFLPGVISYYDDEKDEYRDYAVRNATIFIDPDTLFCRNIGCVRGTMAHEAFHWYGHLLYARARNILQGDAYKPFVANKCPIRAGGHLNEDIDWMERQANALAPRILMPAETAKPLAQHMAAESGFFTTKSVEAREEIIKKIIDALAATYVVTKQAAKYRMIDFGFYEAKNVYNFNTDEEIYQISTQEAFFIYCSNDMFRTIIDSGRFVYANGYFVINYQKFVEKGDNGKYTLTSYAKDNLQECALRFILRKSSFEEQQLHFNGILLKKNPSGKAAIPDYNATRANEVLLENAKYFEGKRSDFDAENKRLAVISNSQYCWEAIYGLLEIDHMLSPLSFESATLLHENYFYKAKKKDPSPPELETIVCFCAGMDYSLEIANQLLALAGHTFIDKNSTHRAYKYLLTSFRGQPIEYRNAFLVSLQIPPLGTRARK